VLLKRKKGEVQEPKKKDWKGQKLRWLEWGVANYIQRALGRKGRKKNTGAIPIVVRRGLGEGGGGEKKGKKR